MANTIRKVEFTLGKETVKIETGDLAKQANGAVLVTGGRNCRSRQPPSFSENPKAEPIFFPMTVDYRERTYAAGRHPRRIL